MFFSKEQIIISKLNYIQVNKRLTNLFKLNAQFENAYLLEGKLVDEDGFFFTTNNGLRQPFQLYVSGNYLSKSDTDTQIKLIFFVSPLRKGLTLIGLFLPLFVLFLILFFMYFNAIQINDNLLFFIGWLILCFIFSVTSYFAFLYQIDLHYKLIKDVLQVVN